MAFIYKITNNTNSKLYIGKTEKPIANRFAEHARESTKLRCKNRPLYRAFNKYGLENFSLELIEETNEPEIREVYWISYFNSYKNGYNATLGGDGKCYVDRKLVIETYIAGNTIQQTAKLLNHDRKTIIEILINNNIDLRIDHNSKLGELAYNSVLNEELVRKIRSLYIPKKFGKRKIARLLDVSVYAVNNVIYWRTWKHVV